MKFRPKPTMVEAEQWFPGKSINGVDCRDLEIHYSRDEKFYYITKGSLTATNWLSVEAFPGPVSEEKQKSSGGFFSKGYVQFSPKGEETYHREVLPFSIYEVKQGKSGPITEDDRLFLDYGCVERWDKSALDPPQEGWLKTGFGSQRVVPGDWIVTVPDIGGHFLVKPEEFEKNYEPVG